MRRSHIYLLHLAEMPLLWFGLDYWLVRVEMTLASGSNLDLDIGIWILGKYNLSAKLREADLIYTAGNNISKCSEGPNSVIGICSVL